MFRAALANWSVRAVVLPSPSRTASVAAEMVRGASGLDAAPDAYSLDDAAARFLNCVDRGQRPTPRDWRQVGWCLWTTRPALAESRAALAAILHKLASDHSPRLFRQIASAYLTEFDPARPAFDTIASALRARSLTVGSPWDGLQQRLGLFDGAGAPRAVATRALGAGTTAAALLDTSGLKGGPTGTKLAARALTEGLVAIGTLKPVSAEDHLRLVRAWSEAPDGTLLAPDLAPLVIPALVQPLAVTDMGRGVRQEICRFLLGHFGDPRAHNANWLRVDESVRQVVIRWLTTETLEQFFEIVGQVADPGQWRYRGAFWRAVQDAELIRDAIVILGKDAQSRARGIDSSFGVFKSGGRRYVQPNHAVLLLDLGQCVVADWSHDGRCNIWSANDTSRPTINRRSNRPSYTSSDVTRDTGVQSEEDLNAIGVFSHLSSDRYLWQDRVAARIRDHVGILVPRSAYRVRS